MSPTAASAAAATSMVAATLSPGVSNPFKRGGGFRSTANARLQNNYTTYALRQQQQQLNYHNSNNLDGTFISSSSSISPLPANIDTISFAKWSSAQVCDWLARQGFDAYFPVNAEGGQRVHKWIKNGLNLLQATQYDYERVRESLSLSLSF